MSSPIIWIIDNKEVKKITKYPIKKHNLSYLNSVPYRDTIDEIKIKCHLRCNNSERMGYLKTINLNKYNYNIINVTQNNSYFNKNTLLPVEK